jgi:hypothetical protein
MACHLRSSSAYDNSSRRKLVAITAGSQLLAKRVIA